MKDNAPLLYYYNFISLYFNYILLFSKILFFKNINAFIYLIIYCIVSSISTVWKLK